MSIASMGSRAALRQVQQVHSASGKSVATVLVGDAGTAPASVPAADRSPTGEYLQAIAAWIPVEALAVWTAFATSFSIFDTPWKEFMTAGLVAVFAAVYSVGAVSRAQRRLKLEPKIGKRIGTAVLAILALGFWWIGTPGAWATADAGLDPFLAAVVLALAVLALPWLAKLFGVDPVKR